MTKPTLSDPSRPINGTRAAAHDGAAPQPVIAVDDPEGEAIAAEEGCGHPGYTADKKAFVNRLHRIEGQVRGIDRMVREERECVEIITQIAAVRTALEAVALGLLDEHVNHCVAVALASQDPVAAAQKTFDLLEAVDRFARTR